MRLPWQKRSSCSVPQNRPQSPTCETWQVGPAPGDLPRSLRNVSFCAMRTSFPKACITCQRHLFALTARETWQIKRDQRPKLPLRMGAGQQLSARGSRVLVHVSIYQGSQNGYLLDQQPYHCKPKYAARSAASLAELHLRDGLWPHLQLGAAVQVETVISGCGSKDRYQNGTMVSGNMDQTLRNPGSLILTPTHLSKP